MLRTPSSVARASGRRGRAGGRGRRRPTRAPTGSSGSRGSRTFSAPPPTATAPKAARPIERTMTQPGAAAPPRVRPRPDRAAGLRAAACSTGRPARRARRGLPRRRPVRNAVRSRLHGRPRRLRLVPRPAAADRHRRDRRALAWRWWQAPQPAGDRRRSVAARRAYRRVARREFADELWRLRGLADRQPAAPTSRSRSSPRTSTPSRSCWAKSRPPTARKTSTRCARA